MFSNILYDYNSRINFSYKNGEKITLTNGILKC